MRVKPPSPFAYCLLVNFLTLHIKTLCFKLPYYLKIQTSKAITENSGVLGFFSKAFNPNIYLFLVLKMIKCKKYAHTMQGWTKFLVKFHIFIWNIWGLHSRRQFLCAPHTITAYYRQNPWIQHSDTKGEGGVSLFTTALLTRL